MTPIEAEWFRRCHTAGLVHEPFLEVGSARIQGVPNLCDEARSLALRNVTGADLAPGDGVDLTVDFASGSLEARFQTVCVFNVLEHTFDPLTVLRNCLSCVAPGGTLLVVTPAIWPLHRYPIDSCRLLPDWYETFAARAGIELLPEHFCWLSEFGIETIGPAANASDPTFQSRARRTAPARYWTSRIVHKLFDTFGRSHWATHTAIGVAFRIMRNG